MIIHMRNIKKNTISFNLREFDSPVFKFDSSVLISGGVKEGPNLGKAISLI